MSDQIDQLLALKTWAIVGLSNNPDRAAFGVAKLLIERGHSIIPIHPKAEQVHGQTGYAKLGQVPVKIDVVDIFVNSELAGAVVNEAIEIGAQGVWLQLDVIDEGAITRAKDAGLLAVMNRCPAIEYKKRG
jgi:predicted CoA-binding protein